LQDSKEEGSREDEEGARLPQRKAYSISYSHQGAAEAPDFHTHSEADSDGNRYCDQDADADKHVDLDFHGDEHPGSVSDKYIKGRSRVATGSHIRYSDRDCYG
jgi:hypothetical protein